MKNQVQCEGLRLLIVALAIACFTVFAHGAVVRPVDDGRPLSNPGMGFTMQYYSNLPFYGDRLDPADTLEWFPSANVCYLRLPWCKLEPEEGVFNGSALDTPAQRWLRRGGQIALRVTASEHWLRFATPQWVKDAGAKGRNTFLVSSIQRPNFREGHCRGILISAMRFFCRSSRIS